MIKFYVPDGHLEGKALDLFARAGFKVRISDREYNPSIDDEGILLKRLRPQDAPFLLGVGKGDLGMAGSDIIREFELSNPSLAKNVVKLLDLGFGGTKLAVAVSEEVLPNVESISDFRRYAAKVEDKGGSVVVATEYPAIIGDYLKKNKIKAVIRKPAGKTEAWVVPPTPEADLIVDTTETGATLKANRCRVLEFIMTTSAYLITNKKSLKDKAKKRKIDEIVKLFDGALKSKGKVNVYLNVDEPGNLEGVLSAIKKYVKKPTISELLGGGFDVFVVMDERDLKYILPELRRKGASSIAISDTRLILE
ncbi:MAG: ATP phosphoribosyltransferase [Candidatus Altiarchaeota archaeon]